MKKRLTMFMACLFLSLGVAMAQTKVNGTVYSQDDNEPVIGASVLVVGTQIGTVTDSKGSFSLTVPAGKSMLRITYVGMEPIEVSARPNMRILLTNDQKALDEVVVVAYGTAKRQSITGAVSSIDAAEIDKRIGTSVTAALEGAAPGVQVNNTYGEPGSEPTILIRGIGSINGSNTPLYVVDGVIYSGNIADLNPNDIQSMSVLKDAASAALYGNRASAGVVIITTKNARSQNVPTIGLKINTGTYTRGIGEYDRLGINQWMESEWTALKNYAMTLKSLKYDEAKAKEYASQQIINTVQRNIFDKGDTELFDADGHFVGNVLPGYTDLDWNDAVERTGHRQEYNLTGAYSTDKVNVYSSLGYLNEEGYIIGSDYKRYTARINTSFSPSKWITTGLNINATYSESHFNDNAYGTYYANPFYMTRMMAPIYPYYMHNADGSIMNDDLGNPIWDTTSSYLDNRNIGYEKRTDFELRRRGVIDAQAFVTLNLPYDFSLTVKGNMAYRTNNGSEYNNPEIGDGATNGGRFSGSSYVYKNYTMQELLNWNHDFGVHHVDALIGHENYQYKRSSLYGMNTGAAVDGIKVMNNFLTNSYLYGADDEYTTESYLARVRYNYDQKYFFDASWRRDGSSRFHKDNRWGNFFSFGASWNIKKEFFLKDVKWVDQLRLRASYGETGNDASVGYYAYKALYYIDKNGGNAALMKQSLSANDIKWETAQTVDFAVEGNLFNRLNFSIGYFDRRNKDLLFAVRLPLSAGGWSYNEDDYNMTINKNIGTISNRGWEISLDGDIIKNKDWKWNLGFDATFLKNEIITLPDGNNIISGNHNYTEGRSLYDYYMYHFVGVDQMTGNSLYTLDPEQEKAAASQGELVEINGVKYTTDTAYGLRDFNGTAQPDVYGSIHTDLSWRDLTLSMLFTYSLGGKVYDSTYQRLMSTNTTSSVSALHEDVLGSWNGIPAGMTEDSPNRIDSNGIPALNFDRSQKNNATSDRFLTDASYLVCKNINLQYNVPKKWLDALHIGVSGVNLNFGVENLFTLTKRKGMNPQYSFLGGQDQTYVTARVFNFGIGVNF